MKLSRFLLLITLLTLFSLLYVYQQTEIFRLAYVGQKRSTILQDALDRNSILRYNIERKVSLVQLGSKISGDNDFQMPDTYRLVRLVPSREGLRLKEGQQGKETILSRLFGIKRQAEAKTVSP